MAKGRNATTPLEIPAPGWKDVAFRVKDEIAQDSVGLIAAGVAFYGLLALFPAVTAVLAIGGMAIEPNQIVSQLDAFSGIVPEEVMTIITDQATKVAGSREAGLGLTAVFGILVALYSASKGMGSLMEGMNVAYDETEQRGFFKLLFTKLGLTLFLIFGLLVALGTMIGVTAAVSVIDASPFVEAIGTGVVWLVMAALTVVGLAVLYRYGPSRDEPEFKWVSAGAVLACIVWFIGSAGFAFYVANFGSYNESFGTLGGVIVLLTWFWISAFIILLGAELNAEMEAQTRHDTTTGRDQPMGLRGARKADELGETRTA